MADVDEPTLVMGALETFPDNQVL